MGKVNLLPADIYIVINKTILTEHDKKTLINLYEPIVGSTAISLYLTLWSDLDKRELISKDYNHHHLMTISKNSLNEIKEARKALEAVGLLKTYLKEDNNLNSYVYELYSPVSAYEFFNHPILNPVLYNNIGESEYKLLTQYYEKPKFSYNGYDDISNKIDDTFKSVSNFDALNENIQKKATSKINISNLIDFDLLTESIPNRVLNEKAFNKATKELINNLAFIYNLDTLKISEIIRITINENGFIDKETLKKEVRKYYEYNSGGALPTLIYRTQPEHLKSPEGDLSNRGKMLYIFENTTPYDFLKSKYKNANPIPSDLKLLEYLANDLKLKPAVINVLVDYVLKINNNKLTKAYVEAIAAQWVREEIETAKGAMDLAEAEYKKTKQYKTKIKATMPLPVWFNVDTKSADITKEEQEEMEKLLSEFK